MNYVFYLENGGNTPQPQISEDELIQLVQAAMSGDSDAGQMLEQLMLADPSILGTVEQIVQGLQLSAQSMKCGGRVKKKETGSKIVKAEKAKCGCALRKVGGRLIEVDSCTGLPIHRKGAAVDNYNLSQVDNAALTEDQLNATSFKNGGTMSYADYLK